MKKSVLSFEEKTTQPWFTYSFINGKQHVYTTNRHWLFQQ